MPVVAVSVVCDALLSNITHRPLLRGAYRAFIEKSPGTIAKSVRNNRRNDRDNDDSIHGNGWRFLAL